MILSKLSVSLTKKLFNGTANYSNCPNFSYPKHIILTLLGAATPVGKIAALLLKQNPHVNELRLYDNDMKCCTIAADLSQINSNTKVTAYSGLDVLKDAITVCTSAIKPLHYSSLLFLTGFTNHCYLHWQTEIFPERDAEGSI